MAALVALTLGCHEPATTLSQLDSARGLAADLRVQFNKGADASNRAVMADSDEASIAFAKESEKATLVVAKDVKELAPLLQALAFPEEVGDLDAFKVHYAEYGELDRKILALAIENTNLKAQALSFGPAKQAADKLRDSLTPLAASFPPKDQCHAAALVAQAVIAVLEVQVLQAPHIAERNEPAMAKMEAEMAILASTAADALKALDELAPASARPALTSARAALDELKATSAKIVQLSRRNTNLLSLDLSLNKKPALAATCDDRLSALQIALAKEGSKATR